MARRKQAVVVLGAGASKFSSNDVLPFEQGWEPPLAIDLFMFRKARQHVWNLIAPYPGAQSVAAQLQSTMRRGGGDMWNLEAELSKIAEHL